MLQEKFIELERAASKTFVQREETIRLCVTALLSRQHLFMLGAPGTAKSAMVKWFTDAFVDARSFHTQLTKFTTPEEVAGPFDVRRFEEGVYVKLTDGYLPTAQIAFLDEIWKASNAILNTLLTVINERKFYNGNTVQQCPLISVFAASNELPANSDLLALFDRFVLKTVVKEIENQDGLANLMFGGSERVPAPKITLSELELAQREVADVVVPHSLLQQVAVVVFKLRRQQIRISDRTVVSSCANVLPITGQKALSVIKAQAWLAGRTKCQPDDLKVLRHCFWESPEQEALVSRVIGEVADPYETKLSMLVEDLSKKVNDGFEKINDGASVIEVGSEINRAIDHTKSQIRKIQKDSGDLLSEESVNEALDQVKQMRDRLMKMIEG